MTTWNDDELGGSSSSPPLATQVDAVDLITIEQGGLQKKASLNVPWTFGGGLTANTLTVTGALNVGGQIKAADGSQGAPAVAFTSNPDCGLYISGAQLRFASDAAFCFYVQTAEIGIPSDSAVFTMGGSQDIKIARDAANVLAQRNGTTAQALRVYNTFTDASNYERAIIRWSGNALSIGTEAGGSGTGRGMAIGTFSAGGNLDFWQGGGLRWFIEGTNFKAATDNASDIGQSGANRPRTGYFGTSVVTPVVSIPSGGSTSISSGTGTVKMTSANNANNAAWIPITYAGTVYYVPGWTAHNP